MSKIKTNFVEQTNNPIFYETKEFTFESFGNSEEEAIKNAAPIVMEVFDTDVGIFDSTDDYMGRTFIFLDDPEYQSAIGFDVNRIEKPMWFPIKYAMDSPEDKENGARILVSFTITGFDTDFPVDTENVRLHEQVINPITKLPILMPELGIESYNIVINALGLRGLVSTGLLPVKKAYVKFSVKSLLPPE